MILHPVLAARNKGLTLIESIIVLAITAVIMGGAAVALSNVIGSSNKQTYVSDLENIQALIIKARSYARTNRFNDNWGIKELIQSTTGCGASAATNCFVLFKGKDYATRNAAYDEVVTFNSGLGRWDSTNNESEMYWQRMTGWGVGLANAYGTDASGFRLRNSDGTFDCTIKVGVWGVVYNSCE